jgi:hypothetical protein
MLLAVAQQRANCLPGMLHRSMPVMMLKNDFESVAVRIRSLGSVPSATATSMVRRLANVSCPRGRTFVSTGVHPMWHGVANRMDYELLAWCSLAHELHGQPVRKRWVEGREKD